jgi:histidinol phosphatase-like enzyme
MIRYLFDLDGTLVMPQSDCFYPGVLERLAEIKGDFAIVTNQGGVGWQYCYKKLGRDHKRYPTLGNILARLSHIFRQIHKATHHRVRVYVAIHHGSWHHPAPEIERPNGILRQQMAGGEIYVCSHMEWRKPRPGMLSKAMRRANPADVLMIGDRFEDRVAAFNARCRFMEAKNWRAGKPEPAEMAAVNVA